MSETFYRKHISKNGKASYIPVKEYDSNLTDSLPDGNHLLTIQPGRKSMRYYIEPAFAPMIAAGKIAEDAICTAMLDASEMRPSKPPLTDEQKAAWENFVAAMGDDCRYLQYASTAEMVRAGCQAMIAESEKLLTNPTLKHSFEQFQMLALLSREIQC